MIIALALLLLSTNIFAMNEQYNKTKLQFYLKGCVKMEDNSCIVTFNLTEQITGIFLERLLRFHTIMDPQTQKSIITSLYSGQNRSSNYKDLFTKILDKNIKQYYGEAIAAITTNETAWAKKPVEELEVINDIFAFDQTVFHDITGLEALEQKAYLIQLPLAKKQSWCTIF